MQPTFEKYNEKEASTSYTFGHSSKPFGRKSAGPLDYQRYDQGIVGQVLNEDKATPSVKYETQSLEVKPHTQATNSVGPPRGRPQMGTANV